MNAHYRADQVGSLLRPPELLRARAARAVVPKGKTVVLGLITTKEAPLALARKVWR